MHILVFGGGMQGLVIARNLIARAEKPIVTVADINRPDSLPTGVNFLELNVLDKTKVKDNLKEIDTAVLAVPSQIARVALENILETGTAVADVCFTPEPPTDLFELASRSGSSCVIDCGVAPGISHILAGHAYQELNGLDSLKIYVGGMPQDPPDIFHHAVYFNPTDLLSEYVRPARAREFGKDISPHPLAYEIEIFQDPELGKLEAFLSDGLRTLLPSFPDIPTMKEQTLRYPGHLETMKALCEMGLFEEDAIAGTARALGKKYDAQAYPDFLIMHVEATKGSTKKSWRLLDRAMDGESAMSRTTGYTTAAVAMSLARKQFDKPGVYPPEELGKDKELTENILKDLFDHGVKVLEHAAQAK